MNTIDTSPACIAVAWRGSRNALQFPIELAQKLPPPPPPPNGYRYPPPPEKPPPPPMRPPPPNPPGRSFVGAPPVPPFNAARPLPAPHASLFVSPTALPTSPLPPEQVAGAPYPPDPAVPGEAPPLPGWPLVDKDAAQPWSSPQLVHDEPPPPAATKGVPFEKTTNVPPPPPVHNGSCPTMTNKRVPASRWTKESSTVAPAQPAPYPDAPTADML